MSRINLRYILLPLGVLLILSGLFGCRLFLNSGSPYPTPLPPTWFTSWLHNPVCQPPCWEGITPGVTTMTETVKILRSLPGVEIDSGPTWIPSTALYRLMWTITPDAPPPSWGTAYASDIGIIKEFVISDIFLSPLQNVIESYGWPDDVFLSHCYDTICYIKLIYMQTGMMVDLSLKEDRAADSDVTIAPDSMIDGVWFFEPGEKGFLDGFPSYSEQSSPWRGYGEYKLR